MNRCGFCADGCCMSVCVFRKHEGAFRLGYQPLSLATSAAGTATVWGEGGGGGGGGGAVLVIIITSTAPRVIQLSPDQLNHHGSPHGPPVQTAPSRQAGGDETLPGGLLLSPLLYR